MTINFIVYHSLTPKTDFRSKSWKADSLLSKIACPYARLP